MLTTTSEPQLSASPSPPTARRSTYLPFSRPAIDEDEIQEVVDALRSDWISTGPKAKQFEEHFAAHTRAPSALGLNSATAGLHTALVVGGIKAGDEVITTPMTFAASVNVIEHVGATPVLVDVEPDTLNISPEAVAAAVTRRTRAIIPVHYAGHPVALDAITDTAQRHDLLLIEDAAHAIGASHKGRAIGESDNPVAFSFYATKNLTTSEGGMLTAAQDFIDRARIVALHGMSRDAWKRYAKGGSWRYEVLLPGFKYNMTDIQASIGLAQLRKFESLQERRRAIVRRYHEAFANSDALELPVERPDVRHAWHLYVLRLNTSALRIDRDRFIEELTARNIGTSVHFIPIHLHPYYRDKYGLRPDDFPVTTANFERMISLPLHPRLTDQDVDDVSAAVLDVVDAFSR